MAIPHSSQLNDSESQTEQHSLGGGTERLDGTAIVDHDHAVGNRFEHELKLRLAHPQVMLDPLEIGDVVADLDDSRVVAVAAQKPAALHHEGATILVTADQLATPFAVRVQCGGDDLRGFR